MKTTVTMAVMTVVFASVAAMASTTGTVDLTLTYNQDSGLYLFQVRASAGDNAGIASYGVNLTGHDTLVNVGPYVDGWNKGYTSLLLDGFVWRGINCVGDLELAGTQDTINDGVNLIYGFGQTAGDLTPPEGWPAVPEHEELQAVYDAPLVLAHGTFTGGAPTCEYAEFNLFDVIGDEQPSLAQTVLHVVDNPALLAGNVDLDNDVDIFDWAIFQTNYGWQAALWTGGDFDFDGDVDIFDWTDFQVNYGTVFPGFPVEVDTVVMPAPPFGDPQGQDINGDGQVEMFDFLIFQRNYGNSGGMTPADGDLDGDGDVDIFDWVIFDTWLPFSPGLAAPAPEPATAMLLAFGAAAVFGKIRRM